MRTEPATTATMATDEPRCPARRAAHRAPPPWRRSRRSGGRPIIDSVHRPAATASTGIDLSDAGQAAQVAAPGGVVDHADRQEQAALEQRVGHEQGDAGGGDRPVADAEEHHEEAELRHGAERQRLLGVVTPQRSDAAEQHRGPADDDQQRPPPAEHSSGRGEAGDEDHPGLDHRRRVQVRAHRRRCGHRPGQPEVQRHLRRLAERPDDHEHQPHLARSSTRGAAAITAADPTSRPRAPGTAARRAAPARRRR